MKDVVEGAMEALPRPAEELTWTDIWLITVVVACAFVSCMLLVHAFVTR